MLLALVPPMTGCIDRPSTRAAPVRDPNRTELIKDFGLILVPTPDSSVPLEHSFELLNASGEAFSFSDKWASCACTHSALGADRLDAGASTTLHMEVRHWSRRTPAEVETQVITTNGYTYTCKLRATIVPVIDLEPDSLYLGLLRLGDSAKAKMQLKLNWTENAPAAELASILSNHPSVTATVSSPTSSKSDGAVASSSYSIDVTVGPRLPDASARAELVVTARRGSETTTYAIPVSWLNRQLLESNPKRVHFPPSDADGQASARIVVTNVDGTPFRITEINNPISWIRVDRQNTDSMVRHTLDLLLSPGNDSGNDFNGALTVHTDIPGQPVLTIPVSRLPPSIPISP